MEKWRHCCDHGTPERNRSSTWAFLIFSKILFFSILPVVSKHFHFSMILNLVYFLVFFFYFSMISNLILKNTFLGGARMKKNSEKAPEGKRICRHLWFPLTGRSYSVQSQQLYEDIEEKHASITMLVDKVQSTTLGTIFLISGMLPVSHAIFDYPPPHLWTLPLHMQ